MTRSICFLVGFLSLFQLARSGDTLVGIAKVDITPPLGISLNGTISQNGPATAVHDRLHVRSIAVKNGPDVLAMAIVDNTMISVSIIDEAKEIIEKQAGIPGSHVIIAATHAHSTPRAIVGLVDEESHINYLHSLSTKIAEAVVQARNSSIPSRIGWGSFDAPEYVHNRRWFVEKNARKPNPFGEIGEVVKMNPGRKGLIKPAGPVDPRIFLLAAETADGQPRAVLANYGLHYIGGTGRGNLSADYYGAFSDSIGKKLHAADNGSFLGIMSNGSSGDVNAIDFTRPPIKAKPYERIEQVADDLTSRAASVVEKIQYHSDMTLDAVEGVLKLQVRKPDQARRKWAEKNRAPEGMRLRQNRTQVYAREALALAEFPDTVDVRLQAFRIGDLAIVSIPCEVFAETGLAIKKNSPFPGNTFTIELANGYNGYLPSARQHEWGGYETWPARSAYLEKSAEEKIRHEALRLLNELRKRYQ